MIDHHLKCSALLIQEHQGSMMIEAEARVVGNHHEPAPPDILYHELPTHDLNIYNGGKVHTHKCRERAYQVK